MADQNFDSRLQIFFDMCDKNGNGRISEDESKEVIVLSASANKLAKLKENAAEYSGLIMEELDPDHLGYIEVISNSNHSFIGIPICVHFDFFCHGNKKNDANDMQRI